MKWLCTSFILLTNPTFCQGWSSVSSLRLKPPTLHTRSALKSKNDHNVVLRPSANPTSFDSFKIGTARVHRYSDPDTTADDSEYIMWYHARDTSLNHADNSLPPLSTGRIGRATSRNGLIWERDETGSFDADREGVSLGLNTDSWWGFDTAHIGLGQVLLPMVSPSIRSEGGVYVMYYMGGSYEETKIADYLDHEKSARVPEGATIKGMKLKIGAAISQDGVTWGRIEGDDPSGACMVPHDLNDSNSQNFGKDVPEELYCGWPEVVVNPVAASESSRRAATDNNRDNFFMYYSTMLKDSKEKAIGMAVSTNGFGWSKRGIVLSPSPGTFDGAGCARCNVVRKATLDEEGFWVEKENSWIMFYEGVSSNDGKHRILAAESSDLKTWTKIGLVLDVGEGEQAWDCKGVGSPHVIRLDDGYFRMYYTGEGSDGETAIGVAKSVDMHNWEREQAGLVFSLE
ncbi:hypothetical protein HJC23_010505 [Cyclotella cryptica]|uniref:Glycosyl hydrolase family 32 N-terminal domain-containing protein n=1 Tax=Cyclotella cryptica TaxID=29204 RepID=A0ABD3QAE3_9STRA|eukprot:CCRYP_007075-RA/>CCRYP_007075-RA protein AED:0.20 eAED:0.20 QI:95/1/1/1/1/1/2/830/456